MDPLDVRILRELARDARASYEEVAAVVGLSANAVAARVKRLGESGVLRGFAAAPDPALLGMREGLLVFQHVDDLDTREAEVLAGLPDVPGVRFVDVSPDGSVHVRAYHADDADWERIERAAISLVGKPPSLALRGPALEPAQLAAADWRVTRALVEDARRPLKDVARAAGLSFKTAKRRLADLVRARRLRLEPVLSPAEAHGLVLATMSVQLRADARIADVLALLPDTTIVQSDPGSPVVLLHVARASLREAQDDLLAVRACPAVERVLFALPTRRRADGWLDDAIAARLEALRAPPAAPVAPVPVPRPK